MAIWLEVTRAAVLVALGAVWLRNHLAWRLPHAGSACLRGLPARGERAVAELLSLHPDFITWFRNAGVDVQVGATFLCVLELVALTFVAWITWQ